MQLWTTWYENAAAMNAAAFTIAARHALVARALFSGDPSGGPEVRRMIAEKGTAAAEGYVRWLATLPAMYASMWQHAFIGQRAFARPALRKVRANMKRLAKPAPVTPRRRSRRRSA
ncbi:MAG: hypothetical protein AB7K86_20110 [Rhodospirillales bacterium]